MSKIAFHFSPWNYNIWEETTERHEIFWLRAIKTKDFCYSKQNCAQLQSAILYALACTSVCSFIVCYSQYWRICPPFTFVNALHISSFSVGWRVALTPLQMHTSRGLQGAELPNAIDGRSDTWIAFYCFASPCAPIFFAYSSVRIYALFAFSLSSKRKRRKHEAANKHLISIMLHQQMNIRLQWS